MTLTYLRPALAIALALGLAACGGKATFPIAGTIVGLNYDGLVLSTNGMDLPVAAKATSFRFPNTLSYGELYSVVVKVVNGKEAQPAHQTCAVRAFTGATGVTYNGPSDSAGRFGTINIGVLCTTNLIVLSGKINGLEAASTGLRLNNGSDATIDVLPTDVKFTFPPVEFGKTYSITVLNPPAGKVCTVSNGTGQMSDDAPANIEVNCVNKA